MTVSDRTALADAPPSRARALGAAASVTSLGTLAWIAWLWGLVLAGNAIALGAIARWGSLDESLWAQAGAGWQRWVLGAAGITMIATFLPMFVTHGATRRQLAQAAAVAMVVLAVVGALFVTLGFWLEGFVFDAQDWAHVLDNDSRAIADIGLGRILLSYGLTYAAWFVGGWLVACGLYLGGWFGLVPGLIVGLVPVTVTELMVLNGVGATQFDFLDQLDAPRLAIGAPIAAATIVISVAAAMRASRSIQID